MGDDLGSECDGWLNCGTILLELSGTLHLLWICSCVRFQGHHLLDHYLATRSRDGTLAFTAGAGRGAVRPLEKVGHVLSLEARLEHAVNEVVD